MFRFCMSKAKDHHCGRIELCVLEWNTPAIEFYEKNHAKRLNWYFYRLTAEQIDEHLAEK